MTCKLGCTRKPDHPGSCYARRSLRPESTGNAWADAFRLARSNRMARAHRAAPQPKAAALPIALQRAAFQVAAADLAYERSLHDVGPHAARVILREQCVPARQEYRRALDQAATEAP